MYARVAAFTRLALLIAVLAPGASLGREQSFTLGGSSCREYIDDVTTDGALQGLYDAWLGGYIDVVNDQLPLPVDVAPDVAREWVTSYCRRHTADTYLTAAVRLVVRRENGRPSLFDAVARP